MTRPTSRTYRVGTRGSLLARTQTGQVVDRLRALHPHAVLEEIVIRTSGDRQQREIVGAFVRELQEALLNRDIDLAVHSMKDLPTDRPEGLTIVAVPAREEREDAIVSPLGVLAALPAGARVGTGSVRRSAQLRAHRPDLVCLPLVGNVDTRLRKMLDGQYDAIVLSVAGMKRLGLLVGLSDPSDSPDHALNFGGVSLSVDILSESVMLPAPGQGALAIECRADDEEVRQLVTPLDALETERCTTAERALLAALGGGCRTPIGASARIDSSVLELTAVVLSPDGSRAVRGTDAGPQEQAEEIGRRLAARLMVEGATELLAGCS